MDTYQNLIRQATGGDTKAFSELVRRFSSMARAVALQRLRDPALAEDALQEALLAAWLHLPGLRNPDAFPSWLRGIVVNSCRRMLRSRTPDILTCDLENLENLAADDLDPFEHYARFQTRDMIQTFLASLSGVYHEAAVQRYLLGRSHEEIALALGVPVGTIKRRLHETRDRMMRALAGQHARTIRVGYLPISDHLLPMIAHQRHDQTSFNVCLRKFLSWSELTRALVNESLDAAMMMAPLAMALHNRSGSISWLMDGHHDGSAITVHPSMARDLTRNPSRVWARDLGGATLGLPHPLSTQGLLLRSVLGLGLSGGPGPFRPRYMNPSSMSRPLVSRRLDGFFCAEPWGLLAEGKGMGKILIRSRDLKPGHVCCILVVRNAFARAQPQLVADYLKLLDSAAGYARTHPEESGAIQARYTGVDRNAAAAALQRGFISFNDLTPDRGRAQQLMSMALCAGILDRPCDLNALLPSAHS
jgi:NitT/TauT family transport system substrate-binding protein